MSKQPTSDEDSHEHRFGIAGGSVVGQDLNQLLVKRPESTFYLKTATEHPEFNLSKGDILVIDRSIIPRKNELVIVTDEQDFHVARHVADTLVWGCVTYIIHQQANR